MGSMPSVDTVEEAHELVAGQEENELLNLNEMPFDETYHPAEGDRAASEQSASDREGDAGRDSVSERRD